MTISTTSIVLNRIRSATKESKIAVFRTEGGVKYNAVFAGTAKTLRMIERESHTFIGSFYGHGGEQQFREFV